MKINGEECKAIPGYSRYVISEGGRIYRVVPSNSKEKERLEKNTDKNYIRESKIQFYDERIRGRWSQVGLINDKDKFGTAAAEKLFCTTYKLWPDRKHKYSIDFKDGNSHNIRIDNIVISKQKPNNSKLSDDQVKDIKKLISKKTPLRHIAKHYGVSDMQICRIKTGENWSKGGRKNPPPKAPIEVKDGKIRRLISTFEFSEIDENIRRPFSIKRGETSDELKLIGVLNGYRFSKTHKNISRAKNMVYKLNCYFFNEDIARKIDEKFISQAKTKKKTKPKAVVV